MDETPLTTEQKRQRDLQRTQVKMDLVKDVSTLSSGTIVLLATFLSKSSTVAAGNRRWLLVSVCSLITCLVSSLMYFWIFGLARQWQRLQPPTFARPLERSWAFWWLWASFSVSYSWRFCDRRFKVAHYQTRRAIALRGIPIYIAAWVEN